MTSRYEWTAAPWRRSAGRLPGKAGDRGRTATDNRAVGNGVRWVRRSGAQGKHLPARDGNWESLPTRVTRWAKAGVWEGLWAMFMQDPKTHYLLLDATLTCAHQQAAAGRGGIGTRRWGVPAGA